MDWLRRAADYPFFDNDGYPVAFAHRGGALTGSNLGLENSMVAFQAAVDLGYRYVETDVHATSDGVVLAFHDAVLDRVTDRSGAVMEQPYADVREARIDGREPIPLLSDLLTTWPDLRVNVDAKSARAVAPLAKVIADHGAWDRVCVASFSPRRIRQLRSLLGVRVACSYASWGVAALRLLPGHRVRLLATGRVAQAAQVPVRHGGIEIVTQSFVEDAHRLGKHVHVWTIDSPEEMSRLLDLGVDGIMTDRTDLLRDVYRARAVWRE